MEAAILLLLGGVIGVSEWGLIAMALLVLIASTLVYARRRPALG